MLRLNRVIFALAAISSLVVFAPSLSASDVSWDMDRAFNAKTTNVSWDTDDAKVDNSYENVYAKAKKGEKVTWTGQPPGMSSGTYTLWLENNVVVMRKEDTVKSVTPFRGSIYDPDHTCDQCGREQREVEQFLSNGRHTHRCAWCGNVWQH